MIEENVDFLRREGNQAPVTDGKKCTSDRKPNRSPKS